MPRPTEPAITAPKKRSSGWRRWPTPGGLVWLALHELRLQLRGQVTRRYVWFPVLFMLAIWFGLHGFAWAALGAFTGGLPNKMMNVAGTIVLVFCGVTFLTALSATLVFTVKRSDVDLLLASPIPVGRIARARLFALMLSGSAVLLLVATPFAHMGVARGHWQLAAIYPVALSISGICAFAAISVYLGAVRVLGPQRGRRVIQVLVGVAGFCLAMIGPLMDSRRGFFGIRLDPNSPWLSPESPLWWPLRAMLGEALPLFLLASLGALSLTLGVRLLQAPIIRLMQASAAAGMSTRHAAGTTQFARAGRWRVVRVMMTKEWRTLTRDPRLVSLALAQSLAWLPAIVIIGRKAEVDASLAAASVMVCATLGGVLGWLTASAEEVPELVGTAPVRAGQVVIAKLVVASIPPTAIATVIAAWLAVQSPGDALLAWVLAVWAALNAVALELTYPRRQKRTDLAKRHQRGFAVQIVENITAVAIAAAAFMVLSGIVVGALLLLFAAAVTIYVFTRLESRVESGLVLAVQE